MNHHDLCLEWARGARRPRRKSTSMFYEGDTIYSWGYHWPLAKKVTLSDTGRTVALVHDRSHTPSTNRHLSHVRSVIGWRNYHHVSHDLFSTVTDEASLAEAKRLTAEEDKDIAYEARIARNERAKRNREHTACMCRQTLEQQIGMDLDDMSNSACLALHNKLLATGFHNNWHHSRYAPHLVDKHPELVQMLRQVIGDDPSVVKRPGFLHTLIENFKLLAA